MSPPAFQMKRPGGDLGLRHVTKTTGIGTRSSQSTSQEMATHAVLRQTNAQRLGNEDSTTPLSIPQFQGRKELLQGFHQRPSGIGFDKRLTEKEAQETVTETDTETDEDVEGSSITYRRYRTTNRWLDIGADEADEAEERRYRREERRRRRRELEEERESTQITEPDAFAERARRREGSALEKAGRERGGIHSTISKDLTTGGDARHATQLANFGQRLSRFSQQTRSMSTAEDSRERQADMEQSPSISESEMDFQKLYAMKSRRPRVRGGTGTYVYR